MTASNGRTIGRVVAFGIPVGVFLSLAACVIDDGPTGLQIVQDQWLDTGTGAKSCTIPGTATDPFRGRGRLDVTVLDTAYTRYYLYPLVENTLASLNGLEGSGPSGAVEEKNNILMESFHVKLDVAGSGFTWASDCSGEFDVPVVNWLLKPGATVGYSVEIIRPCNAAPLFQYLQPQYVQGQGLPRVAVTATIRAKGHLGSSDIESPPFRFPVDVCYGCLQTVAQFTFPEVPLCSNLTTNPYSGDPCNPAQDEPILCCATSFDAQGHATAVECPAVPTGTAH